MVIAPLRGDRRQFSAAEGVKFGELAANDFHSALRVIQKRKRAGDVPGKIAADLYVEIIITNTI